VKISNADKWFSLFIRIRDTQEDGYCRCITCGRVVTPKECDCGHYVKRQHLATRFSEENCHAQCKRCNAFEQGRDAEYRRKLVEIYGEDKVLLLEAGKRTTSKTSATALKLIEQLYKDKAKKLSKEKGIELW